MTSGLWSLIAEFLIHFSFSFLVFFCFFLGPYLFSIPPFLVSVPVLLFTVYWCAFHACNFFNYFHYFHSVINVLLLFLHLFFYSLCQFMYVSIFVPLKIISIWWMVLSSNLVLQSDSLAFIYLDGLIIWINNLFY